MSDDSDDDEKVAKQLAAKKQKIVRYGSLAQSEAVKKIVAKGGASSEDAGDQVQVVGSSPSVVPTIEAPPSTSGTSRSRSESLELDRSNADATREEILAEFERRRKARALVLPTDDAEVKLMLRQLDQPICIFGEDKPERRERLRTLLSLMTEEERDIAFGGDAARRAKEEAAKEGETTWYHEGPDSLRQARMFILKYSLPRAKDRLDHLRQTRRTHGNVSVRLQEAQKWVRNLSAHCSQIGDTRPISYCEFSPNSEILATASWSGLCKLWSIPDCQLIRSLNGHNNHVGCITFHPEATRSLEPHQLNMASCCQDGTIKLWTLDNEDPLGDLEGHAPHRVAHVEFHPSGRFLASCCYDNSWRLFDLEYMEEVLFQEGHSKPVHDLDFQCDGSVALTGGLDAYGRVWDLRVGKCVMFLDGHLRGILSVQFAKNGYSMATGSQDNTCRIWDLRMRRSIYTIPAHKNLVSRVRFEKKRGGDYLVTCSYDSLIKVWSHPGWHTLRSLEGHDSKVMCIDLSRDGRWLASASYDRTFKLWAPDEFAPSVDN